MIPQTPEPSNPNKRKLRNVIVDDEIHNVSLIEGFCNDYTTGIEVVGKALVLSKGDSYQGDGFYKLAEALGFGSWKKLKNDIIFEIGQINACFDFWKDELNYKRWK